MFFCCRHPGVIGQGVLSALQNNLPFEDGYQIPPWGGGEPQLVRHGTNIILEMDANVPLRVFKGTQLLVEAAKCRWKRGIWLGTEGSLCGMLCALMSTVRASPPSLCSCV